MANVNRADDAGRGDLENNRADNPQVSGSRYVAILGPMFGGSFPASVAMYNLLKDSKDIFKFFIFGGVSVGVFAVASGLAAASLGSTNEEARYASCAALVAITIALSLFTSGLCTLFVHQAYKR